MGYFVLVFDDLKQRIEQIEGRSQALCGATGLQTEPWTTGLRALDIAIPKEALATDGCHDFTSVSAKDIPQVAGFIGALLQRLPTQRLNNGMIVWCQTAPNAREYGRIYPPSLLGTRITPDRFLFVNVPKERDLALVLEECIRINSVVAVVGEGAAPNFTTSRRLTLTAQKSGVPCLILNTSGDVGPSAAQTRWRIAPIAGPPQPDDPKGPGHSAWSVTLARARGADTAKNPTLAKPLKVYWNNETHSFDLVSSLRFATSRAEQKTTGSL